MQHKNPTTFSKCDTVNYYYNIYFILLGFFKYIFYLGSFSQDNLMSPVLGMLPVSWIVYVKVQLSAKHVLMGFST